MVLNFFVENVIIWPMHSAPLSIVKHGMVNFFIALTAFKKYTIWKHWWITTDMYDQKLKEFKEKQYNILFKIKQFNNASNTYYITANTVLSLMQRAEKIFESSEPEEKRQLLNFLFLNLKLDGKNLIYKLKTPFEEVLSANAHHTWGGHWESNPNFLRHKQEF